MVDNVLFHDLLLVILLWLGSSVYEHMRRPALFSAPRIKHARLHLTYGPRRS